MTENKKVYVCKHCGITNGKTNHYNHIKVCEVEQKLKAIEEENSLLKERVVSLETTIENHSNELQTKQKQIESLEEQLSYSKDMMKIMLQNNTTQTQEVTQAPAPVKSFSTKGYLNDECRDAFSIETVKKNFEEYVSKFLKEDDIRYIPADNDEPIELMKWIINTSLKGIDKSKMPIRCSDLKNNTFWCKADNQKWGKIINDNGKTVDFNVINHFYKIMCEVIFRLLSDYKKLNKNWIDIDSKQEICNKLFMGLNKTTYNEKVQKKAILLLAEKTLIERP